MNEYESETPSKHHCPLHVKVFFILRKCRPYCYVLVAVYGWKPVQGAKTLPSGKVGQMGKAILLEAGWTEQCKGIFS